MYEFEYHNCQYKDLGLNYFFKIDEMSLGHAIMLTLKLKFYFWVTALCICSCARFPAIMAHLLQTKISLFFFFNWAEHTQMTA